MDSNIIQFPIPLFIVIAIIIFSFLYFFKNYSLLYSGFVGIYISFVISVLFFPFVLNPGENYHFGEELRWAVDFYHPILKLELLPEYTLFHFVLFIPFGFTLRKEFPLKNTILISVAIIFGIENLQLLINFLTLYVQYVYDFGDIIIHLISICIGILIYYPIHCLYPKVQSLYNQIANNE